MDTELKYKLIEINQWEDSQRDLESIINFFLSEKKRGIIKRIFFMYNIQGIERPVYYFHIQHCKPQITNIMDEKLKNEINERYSYFWQVNKVWKFEKDYFKTDATTCIQFIDIHSNCLEFDSSEYLEIQ